MHVVNQKHPENMTVKREVIPFLLFTFLYMLPEMLMSGRGVWGKMDTCTCVAESHPCSAEAITILFVNRLYSNTK